MTENYRISFYFGAGNIVMLVIQHYGGAVCTVLLWGLTLFLCLADYLYGQCEHKVLGIIF